MSTSMRKLGEAEVSKIKAIYAVSEIQSALDAIENEVNNDNFLLVKSIINAWDLQLRSSLNEERNR